MGSPHTEEEWVDEIAGEVEENLQNFTANQQYKDALEEVLREVFKHGGVAALQEVGELALKIIEHNRHPKTSRMRNHARSLLINEYDADIPARSSLY